MRRRAFLQGLATVPFLGSLATLGPRIMPLVGRAHWWEKELDYGRVLVIGIALPRPGQLPWVWATQANAHLKIGLQPVREWVRTYARSHHRQGLPAPRTGVDLFREHFGTPVRDGIIERSLR